MTIEKNRTYRIPKADKAFTKMQIKKQLTDAGIKIVKGNYVRKRDVELYLMEADWKEAIQKFKSIYQPLFKKLVSGILATGLFFGGMGVANAEDFNKAQKSADTFAGVVQEIIDSKGYDLKAEAEAIKEGALFRMKIKVTDVSDSESKGNLCVIDLTKAGSDDNSFVDAKLRSNKDIDDFDIFHSTLCKEIYDSWSKKLLSSK